MRKTLILLLVLGMTPLHALVSLGMESCRIKRMRDGGTQQNGHQEGVRLSYDHLGLFYLGGDVFYSKSELKGHTGSQRTIQSQLSNKTYEGRAGYAYQDETHEFALFTGYGRFREVNDFSSPTPIPFTFTNTFDYIPFGFLAGVNLSSLLSMGFNFKMMFMKNAQTTVSDDPIREDVTLDINEEINIRIETPLTFSPSWAWMHLRFSMTPFYEFRHYGGREGFPFNYIDTKFNLLGARVALVAGF